MARNISIYPSAALDDACALNGGGRNRSHRISQIADRYTEILRRAVLPPFSPAERSLLRDACNGTLHEPAGILPGALALGVADAIALDGLDKKWLVDGPVLIEKLRGLSFPQEIRLIEEIEKSFAPPPETGA